VLREAHLAEALPASSGPLDRRLAATLEPLVVGLGHHRLHFWVPASARMRRTQACASGLVEARKLVDRHSGKRVVETKAGPPIGDLEIGLAGEVTWAV